MTDELTCQQRIGAEMSSRETDLAALFGVTDPDNAFYNPDEDAGEQAYEELHEYALGISTYTLVRIELSTGGPADWLEVKCSDGKYGLEVQQVMYHYSDWFDHAEQVVGDHSSLWGYAEWIVEMIDDDC